MDIEEIKTLILQIAAEVFSVDATSLHGNVKAGDLEQWDSLGHLRFFLELEHRLHVKFSSTEILDIKSIEEIVHAVHSKLSRCP